MPKKRLANSFLAAAAAASAMPKKSLSNLFLFSTRAAAAPPLATAKPRLGSPFSSAAPRSPCVPRKVLSRLKRAVSDRKHAEEALAGEMSAAAISSDISAILRGSSDTVDSPCSLEPNSMMLSKNILGEPWFSDMPGTCTAERRKEVSRERKQKYISQNTEARHFAKLMGMCARKLGTESTLDIFGKLGRDTSIKEYNALIERCIGKARSSMNSNGEKESFVQIHKAYQLLASMRERGFQIEEESYSPVFMYMIDMGMFEEFQIFSKLIKDQNPDSHIRIGYYEMLLWIRAGNEDKVRELCNSIGIGSSEDYYYLAESYLLAFCESDRKEELLELLEVLDISRISSSKYMAIIFKSLGRLQLEGLMKKYILALITTGAQRENLSTFIYDYANSIPEITVEEVVSKFNYLHEKVEFVPSVVSCEKLIADCCSLFKVRTALDIADRMCQNGRDVPIETFQTLLYASEKSCEPDMVQPIYSVMRRHNVKPKADTFKIMIKLRMKIKDFEGAYNLLADMAEMNEVPTISMYNAIMAGYYREKNVRGALRVRKQMKDADVKPDSETFSYLIYNCKSKKDIVKCLDEMKHGGVQLTKHVYMALINAYANIGNYEMAKQVLLNKELPVKFLNDIKSVLVSALSANNQISDALVVYDELKQAGCSLEPRAAICLIDNIRSEGELDRLLHLLEELAYSKYWVHGCSKVVAYCVQYSMTKCAVGLLKQLKNKDKPSTYIVIDQIFNQIWKMEPTNLQMGLDLLCAIKDLQLHPSRTSLDFALSACVKAKDVKRAWLIWAEYSNADLSYNVLTFLRMYQALLASGAHEDAQKLLKQIPQDDPHVCHIINSSIRAFNKQLPTGK